MTTPDIEAIRAALKTSLAEVTDECTGCEDCLGDFAALLAYCDGATAERDALKARVEELEAGIKTHKQGVYRDRQPKCKYNLALYALVSKEAKA